MITTDIEREVTEAESLRECVSVVNRASALSKIVRKAKFTREEVNRVAVANLRAERKAGRMLQDLHLSGGNRRGRTLDQRTTLDSLGIERNESSRWQHLADVPEEDFRRYVDLTSNPTNRLFGRPATRVEKLHHAKIWRQQRRSGSVRSARFAKIRGEVGELICELRSHQQNILSRLEDESTLVAGKLVLPIPEARYIARLLGEMEEHLRSVQKILARGQCGSPMPCRHRIV